MKSTIRQSPQLLRLQAHASAMRAEPTSSERVLFEALRSHQLGVQFRRQVPLLGKYIADFFAPAKRVVVEVDGAYHAKRSAADQRRDRKLRRAGLTVLRIPAELVLEDLPEAIRRIRQAVAADG